MSEAIFVILSAKCQHADTGETEYKEVPFWFVDFDVFDKYAGMSHELIPKFEEYIADVNREFGWIVCEGIECLGGNDQNETVNAVMIYN